MTNTSRTTAWTSAQLECWRAVVARDRAWDGRLVYAVRTTGVYCRPSCPARRPRRQHVEFFVNPDQAERQGYRACRRCTPREADRSMAIVGEICQSIQSKPSARFNLPFWARRAGISPDRLRRIFRQVIGITPAQYARARQVERLKSRLRGHAAVTPAIYDAGFNSSSRAYENIGTRMGMTPNHYRTGGNGHTIDYTIIDSPIGSVLLAATTKGICAVKIGDSETKLRDALADEFHRAMLRRDDRRLRPWAMVLVRYLQTGAEFDVPLDVRATAFQWRVFQALRSIPRGATRSYQQIARAIGRPTAARAVARACATNPVALLVPCHRVVRSDGAPGGYFWGVGRKRKLLEMERATDCNPPPTTR